METYRKIATVKAKLFQEGDEDGITHRYGYSEALEDAHYRFDPDIVPYIKTLENQLYKGEFDKHYLCIGIDGEKWLVEKSIFEKTYELVKNK